MKPLCGIPIIQAIFKASFGRQAIDMPRLWYDIHRNCDDGGQHEGRLELITWSTPAADANGEEMGWGNVLVEESEVRGRVWRG